MVKLEICKLFRMKIIIFPILLVLGVVIYSLIGNGEFGYDFSLSMRSYSEIDGKLVSGQKGYEHNKEVALSYEGIVTDEFLEKIQEDYHNSSYADIEGTKFYNSTYNFFDDIFRIGETHYIPKEAVWGECDGAIRYGYAGDWDAYGNIIGNFFKVFTLFIIIFVSPLFTYEKECDMTGAIGAAKYGGIRLLRYKAGAVFLVVNIILSVVLVFVSILHFSQYGFANADVSIQCSTEKALVQAVLNCSVGKLTVYKLLFGILGANIILLITIMVSMLCRSSLSSLGISVVATWILNYSVVHIFIKNSVLDIILGILPINALDIEALVKAVSGKALLYMVFGIQLLLLIGIFVVMKGLWRRKVFYR